MGFLDGEKSPFYALEGVCFVIEFDQVWLKFELQIQIQTKLDYGRPADLISELF